MDALSTNPDKQSLVSLCKNMHWSLLQKFAEAEIAMAERAERSGEVPAATFGAKLSRLPEAEFDKAMRTRLVEARTLLAHAQISVSKRDTEWIAHWRLSVGKGGLNTRTFTKHSLDTWAKSVSSDLARLINAA